MTKSPIWPHRMWLWFAQFIHDVSMLAYSSHGRFNTWSSCAEKEPLRDCYRLCLIIPLWWRVACAIPHPPCLLSVDRPLPLYFFFSLSLSLALLFPLAVFFSWHFPPHPFSLSHSSVEPSWFMFLCSFLRMEHQWRDTRTHLRDDDDVRDVTRRNMWSQHQQKREKRGRGKRK